MRRQIIIGVVPVVVLAFVVTYLRMLVSERAAKRAGGSPTRPRVWLWAFGTGLAALVVGALVALASGLAHDSDDLVHSATTGTFMLAPGLVVGLAIGWARWLAVRSIWRSQARCLR